MFANIKKIVIDCFTGIDGKTIDPARVYLAGAVAVFLGGAIVVIFKTHALDFQAFGIGFGALLAGGGLGIAAKSKTEPAA
jgi:uncharacterized membrane protein